MAFTPFKFAFLAAGAALASLTQLPRRDEFSNVAEALRRLGIKAPALQPAATDNWIGGGALIALAALSFWLTFKPDQRIAVTEPVAAPATVLPPVGQLPDMPIRELFLSLAPDLADPAHGRERGQAVAEHIRQMLVESHLLAWGKPEADSRMLYPIAPEFWQSAEWTFWFLPADPRNRDLVHVALPDGSSPWRDLHVSAEGAHTVFEGK